MTQRSFSKIHNNAILIPTHTYTHIYVRMFICICWHQIISWLKVYEAKNTHIFISVQYYIIILVISNIIIFYSVIIEILFIYYFLFQDTACPNLQEVLRIKITILLLCIFFIKNVIITEHKNVKNNFCEYEP